MKNTKKLQSKNSPNTKRVLTAALIRSKKLGRQAGAADELLKLTPVEFF